MAPRNLSSPTDHPALDPLSLVPELEAHVQAATDRRKLLQLRRRLEPKPGLGRWIARRLGQRLEPRVLLDAQGTFFVEQLGEARDLGAIAHRMAEHFQRPLPDCREACVIFSRELTRRGLLRLVTPEALS